MLRPRNSLRIWTELLAALASLFGLFYLILIAQTPNMVYFLAAIPLLRPYVDLPWSQFAMLSLPYMSLIFGAGIAVMTSPITRSYAWARTTRLYYLSVAVALLAFNVAIIV